MSERNKTLALIGGLGIVFLVLSGIGYALISGRDIDSFAPTMIGFAIPIVSSLFLAAGVQKQLGEIHTKVNGNFHTLQTENEQLRESLGKMLANADPNNATTQEVAQNTGSMPVVAPDTDTEGRHAR